MDTEREESDGKRVREEGTRKERMFCPSQRAWVIRIQKSKQDPEWHRELSGREDHS